MTFPFVAEIPGVDSSLLRKASSVAKEKRQSSCRFNSVHPGAAPYNAKYPYTGARNGLPGTGRGEILVPAPGDTAHAFQAQGPNAIRGPCTRVLLGDEVGLNGHNLCNPKTFGSSSRSQLTPLFSASRWTPLSPATTVSWPPAMIISSTAPYSGYIQQTGNSNCDRTSIALYRYQRYQPSKVESVFGSCYANVLYMWRKLNASMTSFGLALDELAKDSIPEKLKPMMVLYAILRAVYNSYDHPTCPFAHLFLTKKPRPLL